MTYAIILIVGIVAAYVLGHLRHDKDSAAITKIMAAIKKRLWG